MSSSFRLPTSLPLFFRFGDTRQPLSALLRFFSDQITSVHSLRISAPRLFLLFFSPYAVRLFLKVRGVRTLPLSPWISLLNLTPFLSLPTCTVEDFLIHIISTYTTLLRLFPSRSSPVFVSPQRGPFELLRSQRVLVSIFWIYLTLRISLSFPPQSAVLRPGDPKVIPPP